MKLGARGVAVGVAMTPAWLAYLAALLGYARELGLSEAGLRRAMDVEYLAVLAFPFLGGLAAMPVSGAAVNAGRWLAWVVLAAGLTTFIAHVLGGSAAFLFWMASGLTYLGWLFSPPDEDRWTLLFSRFLLTAASLFALVFATVAVAKLTGSDSTLVLGFLYFLALQVLELSGAFARFDRALRAACR